MKNAFKMIMCFITGFVGGAFIVWWFGIVPIKTRPIDLTQLDSQLTLVKEKTANFIRIIETAIEVDYWNRKIKGGSDE